MMSAHEMDAMGADAKIRAILAREHMRADRAVSASPDRIRQRPGNGSAATLPYLVTLPPLHGDSKGVGPGLMMLRPTHVRRPPCQPSLSWMMTAIS